MSPALRKTLGPNTGIDREGTRVRLHLRTAQWDILDVLVRELRSRIEACRSIGVAVVPGCTPDKTIPGTPMGSGFQSRVFQKSRRSGWACSLLDFAQG